MCKSWAEVKKTRMRTLPCRHILKLRLTRYLQTKTLTNTASRTLPISLKTLKGSNSSGSDAPSWAGFSLASWPRSFMASSKRDRYFWRPRRGEPPTSSDTRSPLGLCRRPPTSSSSDVAGSSQQSGSGEPLLSGVALRERLPRPVASGRKGDGLGEEEGDDHSSVLSRSRWKRGSVGRRDAPEEDMRTTNNWSLIVWYISVESVQLHLVKTTENISGCLIIFHYNSTWQDKRCEVLNEAQKRQAEGSEQLWRGSNCDEQTTVTAARTHGSVLFSLCCRPTEALQRSCASKGQSYFGRKIRSTLNTCFFYNAVADQCLKPCVTL